MPAYLSSPQWAFVLAFPNDDFELVSQGFQRLIRHGTVIEIAIANTVTETVENRLLVNLAYNATIMVSQYNPVVENDDERYVAVLNFSEIWQGARTQAADAATSAATTFEQEWEELTSRYESGSDDADGDEAS